MSSILKVAVVGASGNTGAAIVDALLKHCFEVTAVTRESSTAAFPSGVSVKRVDFTSKASLLTAFGGQDAVISCISQAAVGGQDVILDAAIEAKVKRFLPSDYGIDYMNALDTKAGQSLEGKAKTIQHLKDLAQKHTWFSWTGLAVGLFFDWGLRFELLGFDMVNHAATVIDSGKEPFSATNLATLGQAAAAILHHPEETANRTVKVSSFTTTQNEVLEVLEVKSGAKWKINKVSGEDLEKLGDETKQAGDPLFFALYLQRYIFSDGANTAWKDGQTDNKALDLEVEEEIQDTVSRVLGEYSSRILPS